MALAFIPSISSSSSPPRFFTSSPPPSPSPSPSLHFYGSVGSNISNSTTLSVKSSNLAAPESSRSSLDLGELYESCKTWRWRGHSINFLVKGNGPPLLLVHGFGASIGHWRSTVSSVELRSDAEMEALEVTKSLIASDSFGGAVDWPEAKSLQPVRHCMTPLVQLQ